MNQRYILRTQDSTQYHLIQAGMEGPWTLIFSSGPAGQKQYPSLKLALHCLGGVVQWDVWSPAAKETLLALNDGKTI